VDYHGWMSRPSPLPRFLILACVAALPVGCKTVYSDVYSPRRNYYHPPVEKKVELPVDKKASSTPVAPGPAAPAAIPGLAPAPDILPMPAPAPAPAPAQ
jgi:hypothetical protein